MSINKKPSIIIKAVATIPAIFAGLCASMCWELVAGAPPFLSFWGGATVVFVELTVWHMSIWGLARLFKAIQKHMVTGHDE